VRLREHACAVYHLLDVARSLWLLRQVGLPERALNIVQLLYALLRLTMQAPVGSSMTLPTKSNPLNGVASLYAHTDTNKCTQLAG
jgi:hypothetical protein